MQCNCNYRTMLSTQLRRHLNSSEMGFAGLLIGFKLCILWLLSLAILSVKFGAVLQQCKPRNGLSFCKATVKCLHQLLGGICFVGVWWCQCNVRVWQLVGSWLLRCYCMVFWYFATIQTNKWLVFRQSNCTRLERCKTPTIGWRKFLAS